MDDPEVIRTAFTEAGFDADKLFEQMGNDEIKGALPPIRKCRRPRRVRHSDIFCR